MRSYVLNKCSYGEIKDESFDLAILILKNKPACYEIFSTDYLCYANDCSCL